MNKALIIAIALLFASCNTDTTQIITCTYTIELEYIDRAMRTEVMELPNDTEFNVIASNGGFILLASSNQCWLCDNIFMRRPGVLRYKIIKRKC